MDVVTPYEPVAVAPDTHLLPAWMPLPGFGHLAVNAFVIRAPEPVLVDTGLGALGPAFLEGLGSVVDLEDLRWIWLTHTDPDHVGNLEQVLEAAPRAKVVTTFLGMGKMGLARPLPPDRVHLLNPGQRLDVGDRALLALRPPCFDAPETTGLFDTRSGALFSSDCFGGLLPVPAEVAEEIPADVLRDGVVTWSTVDAPWLHDVDEVRFTRGLLAIRDLSPSIVLSSHLPPARGLTTTLLSHLDTARVAPPFVGPDQAALMAQAGAA